MDKRKIGLFRKLRAKRVGFSRINKSLADGLAGMRVALPLMVTGAENLKAKAYGQGNPTDADWDQLDRLMATIRAAVKAEKELELALGIGNKEDGS